MKIKKRAFFTLLEIMIVIFLISLIAGVMGYKFSGSLETGKVFKTEQAISQLEDILLLEAAKGDKDLTYVEENYKTMLKDSGLVKDPDKLLLDGWNKEFKITVEDNNLKIHSDKYKEYRDKKDQTKTNEIKK